MLSRFALIHTETHNCRKISAVHSAILGEGKKSLFSILGQGLPAILDYDVNIHVGHHFPHS